VGITSKERDTVLRFIERNVRVAPRDLDEGIGTVYERVVIDDYFRDLQKRCNLKNILENPADGVTGVPGMNSLEFARNGATVTLSNPSDKMLDGARAVWVNQGLVDQATFVKCPVDQLPFEDDTFDMVWNYCMFERFKDPSTLVAEMKRVSNRYVLIMTQNVYNWGTMFHKVYHNIGNLEWDHGYDEQMTFPAIRKALRGQGMHLLEEGTDAKYGARHLKRAIERHIVFPLANLVATGQVKLGDFVRIDMTSPGELKFVKEAEGALVPVLLEKYGPEFSAPAPAKAARSAVGRRELGANSNDHK